MDGDEAGFVLLEEGAPGGRQGHVGTSPGRKTRENQLDTDVNYREFGVRSRLNIEMGL